MITGARYDYGADSTLGVEASQETFPEMCEGSVKKLRAIYKETLPAKLVPSNGPKLSCRVRVGVAPQIALFAIRRFPICTFGNLMVPKHESQTKWRFQIARFVSELAASNCFQSRQRIDSSHYRSGKSDSGAVPPFFYSHSHFAQTSLINGLTMPASNPCVNNVDTKERLL